LPVLRVSNSLIEAEICMREANRKKLAAGTMNKLGA
jgi:hypothetical protein